MKRLPRGSLSLLPLILIACLVHYPRITSAAGEVVVWGDNFDGQTNVPAGLTNVVAIAAGGRHCVALKEDGSVVTWGWWTTHGGALAAPQGLTNVVAIAAGSWNSLALTTDGQVAAWGGYQGSRYGPCLSSVRAERAQQYCGCSDRVFPEFGYSLEAKNSLGEISWRPVSSFIGNGRMATLTDTNADLAQRFYRIRLD